MAVTQSKSRTSWKMMTSFDRNSVHEADASNPDGVSGNLDESAALSSLKDLIAAGDRRLDTILVAITEAARQLTGASGAAMAMWKDGAMVCRARSGDTAPPLGAKLSAETGISGECLRTGKTQHCVDTEIDPLVDVEVCRSLGLRSIAVLPIQGWRGINGILEVFSSQPAAFAEAHLALLQQLAALAERARATQPHGASPSAPKTAAALEKPQPSGLLPASDRVGDVALAFVGARSRPLVFGGLGLVAIALIALVIWLGWRGPGDADGAAHAAAPASANAAFSNTANAFSPDRSPLGKRPLDNDPVWKPNPGGEALLPSGEKPAAGTPVKFASKVEVITEKKPPADRAPTDRAPAPADVAANVVVTHEAAKSQTAEQVMRADETASLDPPPIPAALSSPSVLNGVLSPKASLPGLSAPVSQGVSGGQLVRRVSPVYPAQARLQHLEGKVILAATVVEDGTVREVRVIQGSPVLAKAAADAVKNWRYKPYELDGKPVRIENQITIDFKFPQ